MECLALGGGPPGFGLGFTCPALLGIPLGWLGLSDTGLSPSAAGLSRTVPLALAMPRRGPATPGGRPPGLGCSAFARHYLRNHCCSLLLRVMRCFTSPRVAPAGYGLTRRHRGVGPRWIAPFGNLRIKACLPLPGAYRSLPRPSSPHDAKASVMRPCTLDRNSPSRVSVRCSFICGYAVVKEQKSRSEKGFKRGRASQLVEVVGFEPATSSLQSWRSAN